MSYSPAQFEVADIIREHKQYLGETRKFPAQQKKVFTNLSQCRTEALGFHRDKCDNMDCGHVRISYNSCRDRHCPKCNGIKREKWVRMREQDLLPVKYYHVVFTVSDKVNSLFLQHPQLMDKLLFTSAWKTINTFGLDPKHLGAKMGMISILHTWGQNLSLHPHVHCIVPAGGIANNGQWRSTKNNGKFLFPVKAMSQVFRGIFTDGLIKMDKDKQIDLEHKFCPDKKYLHPYYQKKWVTYAKLPMHNAMQVVNYIGRYSHRIAISNHRIKSFENGRVTFSYFNYRTSKTGTIDLSAEDFLLRFSLHILPAGFMKIRHYGILSSRNKAHTITTVREQFESNPAELTEENLEVDLHENSYEMQAFLCPVCKRGKMVVREIRYPKNKGSPQKKLSPNYNFSLQ